MIGLHTLTSQGSVHTKLTQAPATVSRHEHYLLMKIQSELYTTHLTILRRNRTVLKSDTGFIGVDVVKDAFVSDLALGSQTNQAPYVRICRRGARFRARVISRHTGSISLSSTNPQTKREEIHEKGINQSQERAKQRSPSREKATDN